MRFEWDEGKRATNLAKHGVDFADAVGVYEDPFALTRDDPSTSDEERFITLGCGFKGRVLHVVWTERGFDAIRIISTRKASSLSHITRPVCESVCMVHISAAF